MRNQIDIENLENVVKFFQYVSECESSIEKEEHESTLFFDSYVNMEDNIREWENNKKWVYRALGNKVKIKKPLKEKELYNSNLVQKEIRSFLKQYEKQMNPLIVTLITNLEPQEIYNNQLKHDFQFLDKTMKKGWKITRCMNELEPNAKKLAFQQDLFSILLQALKIQGNLVLSIDPLDFVTMSVSKSGWTSCHHPNSCYGTGGMAYMNDYFTAMAYVETENPIQTSIKNPDTGEVVDIYMPNKIWRQLITIQGEAEFALMLAEYPNNSSVYQQAAEELLKETLSSTQQQSYISDYYDYEYENFCLQEPDGYNLEGYAFYCDVANYNTDGAIPIIFSSQFLEVDEVVDAALEGHIDTISVGAEFYCACGCGDVNYTSDFFMEEDEYGDGDHYGNYY